MRKQNDIIRILIFVFAALIALLVIGGGIYLFSASKKLKAIALQPDFSETSLEVGTQYTFTINTTPKKASIKKATCVVDDPTSSFEISDSGKAVLTTGMNEGNVTVYIECKDIKSQVLTFSIVDSVARAQAEAAAQAEAQKAEEEAKLAEEEAAAAEAAAKKYVKATGDDVNVRSTNSTDGDVLGKAKKGDMFEKVEDVDDWTHIMYKGQDGYMKTEFLTEISEEEYQEGATSEGESETAEADTKKDEKKEEKKTEAAAEENNEENNEEKKTQSKEEAEAKAAADAAKAAEDAQKAAEEAAAAVAAAAAAQPATYNLCGVNLTASQYHKILDMWKYATPNGTDEEAKAFHEAHHSAGDIQNIIQSYGIQ
ncbi:MAG: SH3 domain-containing protein [Lachnospiraceae bacterium]|nr:SH3 domain-containing protein [Lachnospiraceae bacterium]